MTLQVRDWLEEKNKRSTALFFLIPGGVVYTGISFFFGWCIYRDGVSSNYPRLVKDGCAKFLAIIFSILVGFVWPLMLVLVIIGRIVECLCIDMESCCGIRMGGMGNKSPKPPVNSPREPARRQPGDVERQSGDNNAAANTNTVVNQQPNHYDDIELPPYPGPSQVAST
ncbi:hypothetical protein QBC41DRAFT_307642 [Cercophora samala]|uniref:Uncharacterized protein n=1 Tax=Cercophora samala TaxID=330535 RepID=A0AA40D3G6_9PEZI|nr:hypothetical protein QBC41DRAFT_307642 [Cercophora samala]